ncbi:MAG: serine/threonine-protein kinase [Planctomycetota bacterium]
MSRALGDLVVAKGLADEDAVARAMERQKTQARGGVFKRLGEILVEDGVLTAEQVGQLLQLQGKEIRVCSVCFAQYNVDHEADPSKVSCARCGHALVVPDKLSSLQVEQDITKKTKARALELASEGRTESERLRIVGDITTRRFGPFEILGEVSRGGMGIVYKARQAELERVVALKVLLQGGADNDEGVRRFRREARAVSRLRHPNIVAIHDVGVVDGVNYFSMDYVEGLTLDQAVTAESLTQRELAEVFVKVCDAVHYAHHQGIVHRDLKPRNILVDKRREPTVIDFGIARVHTKGTDESAEHGALTKSGEILGSPAYLAPEYITGDVPDYDQACDVWSLGACLYSALSGRAPHADADTIRIIRSAATAEAPNLRNIAKNVDRDLARVVMTAVERDRRNRYTTAGELGLDLRRWLNGEDIAARSSALRRWWLRVRMKVAVGFGLLASIALVWSTGYYSSKLIEAQDAESAPDILRERLGAKSVRLGETLLKSGDPTGAERELSDALGLIRGARRVEALYLRAKARRALGNIAAAESDEKDAAAASKTP